MHRAIALDGTCTGEHGVGIGKKEYLVDELGPDTVALMRSVKKAIDPSNIMNPLKVISRHCIQIYVMTNVGHDSSTQATRIYRKTIDIASCKLYYIHIPYIAYEFILP